MFNVHSSKILHPSAESGEETAPIKKNKIEALILKLCKN